MAKTVAKPPVEQSKAVADTAGADLLAIQAAADHTATDTPMSDDDEADPTRDPGLEVFSSVKLTEAQVAEHLLIQKGAEGVAVVVQGPTAGRWRAGRHFGPTPVAIPASDLTGAEYFALQNDPELMVSTVDTRD